MFKAMEVADLPLILKLENELFSAPWKEEDYLYELEENPYSKSYILWEGDDIVGYAGLWVMFEQAQITTIGVSSKYQKQGYGNKLLLYLVDKAKELGSETIPLEVRVSNESAINLYKNAGFEIINIRKSYYSDNHEDAYLMMKGI